VPALWTIGIVIVEYGVMGSSSNVHRPGALHLLDRRSRWVLDTIERSAGRLDFSVPRVLELLTSDELARVDMMIEERKEAAQWTRPLHRSFHIMIVQPGAACQPYHMDNDSVLIDVLCIVVVY
jgi:hypothetical protein